MGGVAQPTAVNGLAVFPEMPAGLLEAPVNRLDTILPGPSLITVPGKSEPPLFVSVLLHGNEVTGFLAIQQLLNDYRRRGEDLPRSMLIFVGNIEAAKYGVRRLAGQADFNRIWAEGEGPEYEVARELLAQLQRRELFAAVDVHNNTGKNPMYGCVNRAEPAFINLARRFSKTLVYFTEPHQVISMAMSKLCPSVTLECGLPGETEGTRRVVEYLDICLRLESLPRELEFDEEVDVFHTVAKILVPEATDVGFGEPDGRVDISFPADFETLNFRLLPHEFPLGRYRAKDRPLIVIDNNGESRGDDYFEYRDGAILTRRPFLLSMLTRDVRVIYQDCLGYIMEHYPIRNAG